LTFPSLKTSLEQKTEIMVVEFVKSKVLQNNDGHTEESK